MDVDVVTESIAGWPSLADDDRRVEHAVTEPHQQVGPTESKPQGVSEYQSKNDKAESDLKELLAVIFRDPKDEIWQHEEDIIATVRAMGGCARRHRRERKNQIKVVASEICSLPRTTAASKFLL